MFRCPRTVVSAAFSILLGVGPAAAETLHCQSINGNLNCAGSGGVSCQTVDGKKVCASGHGDVIQSFGSDQSSGTDDEMDDDQPAPELRMEQHRPGGHTLMIFRDGSRLHVQTDQLSIDRN